MKLKNYLIIVGVIVVFFIIWFIFINMGINNTPKVISTNPRNNSLEVSSIEPIIVNFNNQVDDSKILIKSTPDTNWQITKIREDSISIKSAKYLSYATQYSVDIYYHDKKIHTINFKTAAGQGDPQFYQAVKDVMDRDYPLAAKFPYTTDNYKVVYSAPLELEIRLKENTLSNEEAIEEIKSYVSKNGGDVNAHKFVVVPLSQ